MTPILQPGAEVGDQEAGQLQLQAGGDGPCHRGLSRPAHRYLDI